MQARVVISFPCDCTNVLQLEIKEKQEYMWRENTLYKTLLKVLTAW